MHFQLRSGRHALPVVAILAIASSAVLPVSAAAPYAPVANAAALSRVAETTTSAAPVDDRGARDGGPEVDSAAVAVSHRTIRDFGDGTAASAPASAPVARSPMGVPAARARSELKTVVAPRRVTTTPRFTTTRRVTSTPRVKTTSRVKPSIAPRRATTPTVTRSTTTTLGPNRVSIPSLGINRSVTFFPCSRSEPPGHLVYRWGCAGRNNVYLFAHASSLFKPLHDLYASGNLRKGMRVMYSDANAHVRTYAVTFWKVVRPDGDVGWAYASLSTPSMTLQTCFGTNSQYRLVVRLVQIR